MTNTQTNAQNKINTAKKLALGISASAVAATMMAVSTQAHADTTTTATNQVSVNRNASSVVVKSGDTVGKLAKQYSVSISQIENLNHLNNDLIYVGQNLKLRGANSQVAKTYSYSLPKTNVSTNQKQVTLPKVNTQVSQPKVQTQTSQPKVTPQVSQPKVQTQVSQPKVQQVSQPKAQPTQAPKATNNTSSSNSGSNSAKDWIVNKESGGSYSARNGNYVGKYQLSSDLLHGDYSQANQDKAADQYVNSRYGGWSQAKNFWQSNGWY